MWYSKKRLLFLTANGKVCVYIYTNYTPSHQLCPNKLFGTCVIYHFYMESLMSPLPRVFGGKDFFSILFYKQHLIAS